MYLNKKNDILIPNNKIKDGMVIAKNHAEYFLKMAKDMHEMEDYQLSIPLSVLVFEESSKTYQLDTSRKEGKIISSEEWKDLRDHDFKLTHTDKEVKKDLESESELQTQARRLILQSAGLKDVVTGRDQAIKIKEKSIEVQARFSKVKEICFYANWNKNKNKWDDLNKIPKSSLKLISLFMMYLAEHEFLLANLCVDVLENSFRSIDDEELWDKEKSSKYLAARIEHHKNLKSVQMMRDFEETHEKKMTDLQKGHVMFNKYFSN